MCLLSLAAKAFWGLTEGHDGRQRKTCPYCATVSSWIEWKLVAHDLTSNSRRSGFVDVAVRRRVAKSRKILKAQNSIRIQSETKFCD
jgi:hypothetical protein